MYLEEKILERWTADEPSYRMLQHERTNVQIHTCKNTEKFFQRVRYCTSGNGITWVRLGRREGWDTDPHLFAEPLVEFTPNRWKIWVTSSPLPSWIYITVELLYILCNYSNCAGWNKFRCRNVPKYTNFNVENYPKGVASPCWPFPSQTPSPTCHSTPGWPGLNSAAPDKSKAACCWTDRTGHCHWLMRNPVHSAGCTRNFLPAGREQ